MGKHTRRTAPVTADATISIDASPDRVWGLLADIDRWPRWITAVTSASLLGPVDIGGRFRWTSGRARLVSTLQILDRPRTIGWTGHSMGITAAHRWTIERGESATIVRTEETLDGLPARLLRRRMRTSLRTTLDAWLRDLKTAAESIDRPPRTRPTADHAPEPAPCSHVRDDQRMSPDVAGTFSAREPRPTDAPQTRPVSLSATAAKSRRRDGVPTRASLSDPNAALVAFMLDIGACDANRQR